MTDIIEICVALERNALSLYLELAKVAETDDLKKFWLNIAGDEKKHIRYWEKLLEWAETDMLPQVFDDPDVVFEELDSLYKKTNRLLKNVGKISDIPTSFLYAFKFEFYLLHPAFETLFQYLKNFSDEKSPDDDYEEHINKLFEALRKYGLESMELELLGETIHRLWKENRKMAVQSSHDWLTDSLNRRGLFNAIRPLSHLARRNKNVVGIMMIDIDHFKVINDTFGHHFGDEVLKYVADSIKTNIRGSDIFGRYGGEEFVVFLSAIDPNSLRDVGEKIRMKVKEGGGEKGNVTISIGIASGTITADADAELEALINQADEKMFEAKNAGRDRVVI